MLVESGPDGAGLVICRAPATDGDQPMCGVRVATNGSGDLVTAHVRQADVEQHDRGLERRHGFQDGRAARQSRALVTEDAEKTAHRADEIGLIIDDQDSMSGHARTVPRARRASNALSGHVRERKRA